MTTATERAERAAVFGSLVLVQVFFGLHYLAAKILLENIPPRTWAVIRVAGGAIVLLIATRFLRRPLPRSARDLAYLALLSIFGVVINQVCFVEGLHRTTATHSALINTSIPVSTLVFAVLLRRETPNGRKVLSMLTSFCGVLLVIRPDHVSFSSSTFAGDLLTLANALSYGFFLVVSKRMLARLDSLGATAALMSFGSLGIFILGWPQLLAFHPGAVPAMTWWIGLFIIVFPTAAAYFLIYWALARAESSIVALFIYLQPLIATGLSVAYLGERPGPRVMTGGAMICVGVYLALRPSTPSLPAGGASQPPTSPSALATSS